MEGLRVRKRERVSPPAKHPSPRSTGSEDFVPDPHDERIRDRPLT